jgi:hypothetical protein
MPTGQIKRVCCVFGAGLLSALLGALCLVADSNVPCASTGAWTIHIVIIAALKILYDVIPGSSQEASWTLTNMTYMVGSYIMFHYVRGIPFDFNGGAFDNLNMWEQIDNGAQYTPTKKFLLSVPIVLFLISTHYTHYDSTYFVINFLATLAVIIPKLPFVSAILDSCRSLNLVTFRTNN